MEASLRLERGTVREFDCPRCGAVGGDPCRARRGPRTSNHIERVHVAVRGVGCQNDRHAFTAWRPATGERVVRECVRCGELQWGQA